MNKTWPIVVCPCNVLLDTNKNCYAHDDMQFGILCSTLQKLTHPGDDAAIALQSCLNVNISHGAFGFLWLPWAI